MQNTIKTRSGRTVIMPTPEEDAAINRGIAEDVDTFEVSADDMKKLESAKRRSGRPRLANPKEPVTIRYDSDVLDAFRASGDGWQTRMNDALKDWLRNHRP